MTTTSGVIKSENWGKDKLTVVIEREGTRYTVAHFNPHEAALAEQAYQRRCARTSMTSRAPRAVQRHACRYAQRAVRRVQTREAED